MTTYYYSYHNYHEPSAAAAAAAAAGGNSAAAAAAASSGKLPSVHSQYGSLQAIQSVSAYCPLGMSNIPVNNAEHYSTPQVFQQQARADTGVPETLNYVLH